MATYGLQKALKWFEKNNGNIKIETDTMQLKFSLNAGVAPHLLGLQYMKIIENQVLLQGKELFEHIKKNFYSDQEIFEKIIENSQRGYGHEFNKRNTSLQKFFENLEESKLVENTIESEFLKNEFFLIIKNQETDGSIGKIVDDKNAYFIQKMLINDKLPDDFIKHFEKTFATELDNCKKTFIEQKNIQKDRQEIEK